MSKFGFLILFLLPRPLMAEPPLVNEVSSALHNAANSCSDQLIENKQVTDDWKPLLAEKYGDRLVALVNSDKADVFGVVGINLAKNPKKCSLWYKLVDYSDVKSSIKWGGFNAQGYLSDPNIALIGWWNNGKEEFYVLEEKVTGEHHNEYRLLVTKGGAMIAEVQSGFEYVNEEEDWMDFTKTYSCKADLSEKGRIQLSCENHQGSEPPFKKKVYCWNNNELRECK